MCLGQTSEVYISVCGVMHQRIYRNTILCVIIIDINEATGNIISSLSSEHQPCIILFMISFLKKFPGRMAGQLAEVDATAFLTLERQKAHFPAH